MFLNNKSNKIPLLLLSLMLSSMFHLSIFASENADSVADVFSDNEVKLSEESAKLLKQIRKGVVDYNKKLKSGKVEFTLTLRQRLKVQEQKDKKVEFENVGTWNIVYNFEGTRHFYDVRIRKKMEFNGEPLPNWTEKRYQFQIENKKMLMREFKDKGWSQPTQATDKSIFKSEFNPRRWGWNPDVFSFAFLIKFYNPIKVEPVEVNNDAQLYLITLQRIDNEKSSSVLKLWIDPQKGYRPIRSLKLGKILSTTTLEAPDGTYKRLPPRIAVSRNYTANQIEQFERGIWFPKTATYSIDYDPDTQQEYRKITMKVQKATFNIPIDEKDLRFSD